MSGSAVNGHPIKGHAQKSPRANEGLVVIVTGSSSGNGRAIAVAFAASGAAVVCADLQSEHPNGDVSTHKLILSQGGIATFVTLDVTHPEHWQAAVKSTVEQFGRIDILVNNAGILAAQARVHEMPLVQWEKTIDINLRGVFLGMHYVIPTMLPQEPLRGAARGKIINIASNGASYGVPKSPAYTASKAGVIGLTKQAAVDYSRDGISVNSVSPGLIATPMSEGFLSNKAIAEHFEASTPCGRVGRPSDVASAVLFLASVGADYCYGTDLVIDGGYLCT